MSDAVAVADAGRLDLGLVDRARRQLEVLVDLVGDRELDRPGQLEAVAPDELGGRRHAADEVVLLEAQHAQPAPGHDRGRRQPVVARADDDRVVVRHGDGTLATVGLGVAACAGRPVPRTVRRAERGGRPSGLAADAACAARSSARRCARARVAVRLSWLIVPSATAGSVCACAWRARMPATTWSNSGVPSRGAQLRRLLGGDAAVRDHGVEPFHHACGSIGSPFASVGSVGSVAQWCGQAASAWAPRSGARRSARRSGPSRSRRGGRRGRARRGRGRSRPACRRRGRGRSARRCRGARGCGTPVQDREQRQEDDVQIGRVVPGEAGRDDRGRPCASGRRRRRGRGSRSGEPAVDMSAQNTTSMRSIEPRAVVAAIDQQQRERDQVGEEEGDHAAERDPAVPQRRRQRDVADGADEADDRDERADDARSRGSSRTRGP